jgi:hypothetical protein
MVKSAKKMAATNMEHSAAVAVREAVVAAADQQYRSPFDIA